MAKGFETDVCHVGAEEYRAFKEFLRAACGIDLGDNKQYLVTTRIRRILLANRINSLSDLTDMISRGGGRFLRQQVIDAMTTNETYWFRDGYPFDYLAQRLSKGLSPTGSSKKLRIWSAACSTGQEPYGISMIVAEAARKKFGEKVADTEILATDVSSAVLAVASQACYDRASMARGLTLERIKAHFLQQSEEVWQVRDSIRDRVRFRPFNLQDSYYLLGKFDVIFCRNVLIYFSDALKVEILTKLHSALNPNGILFLGSSESISGLNHLYEMVNCNPGVAYRVRQGTASK